MPSLDKTQTSEFIKMLLIGQPMSGKTGSLASLVKAGYKLRVIDFDAKIHTLKAFVKKDSPDKLANVEVVTLRDKYKSTAFGAQIDGTPKAWATATALIDHWKYEGTDLGAPRTWGKDCVLVIDSLTFAARAAFDWAFPLVPRGAGGNFDPRAVYGKAQDAIFDELMLITAEDFKTNVVVTAHIDYLPMPDGKTKGFPTTIGKALGPNIPAMFPSMAMTFSEVGARKIGTVSNALLDLANPAPFKMQATMGIEEGLATFFKTVKEAT